MTTELRKKLELESLSFREAFDTVHNGIHSVETLDELEATKTLLEQFVEVHKPQQIYRVFLEFLIAGLEKNFIREDIDSRVCYFVSGHRDITQEEFEEHYIPLLDAAMDNGGRFVVGDCMGVDIKAQEYLAEMSYPLVEVYHMFTHPRYHVDLYPTVGGWKSDVDRDWGMTIASDVDIAWIREGKERSGTAQNLWRRGFKEDGVTSIVEVMTRDAEMFL